MGPTRARGAWTNSGYGSKAKRCARLTIVTAMGLATLAMGQFGGSAQASPRPLGSASMLPTSLEALGQPTEDMGAKNFTATSRCSQ